MRKTGIVGLVSFVAGVVVGVVATYKVADQKYRNMAEEEIASVKEMFESRKPVVTEPKPVSVRQPIQNDNESRVSYSTIVKNTGYNTDGVKASKAEEELQKMSMRDDLIHVVTFDEFATIEGFGQETFYYTADNYVLDDEMHALGADEVNDSIGGDPLEFIMDADVDGRIFVRNERRKIDYEIIISERNYDEICDHQN